MKDTHCTYIHKIRKTELCAAYKYYTKYGQKKSVLHSPIIGWEGLLHSPIVLFFSRLEP